MGLKGATHNIMMNRGGMQFPLNVDAMDDFSMLAPSRNINLQNGGRQKRGGTTVKYTVTGLPRIAGVMPFVKLVGTAYVGLASENGDLWNGTTGTIATGLPLT